MSYEELAAHAQEIKELAIQRTIDQGIQASAGAAAYGGVPPIDFLTDQANAMFANTHTIFDDWIDLPDPDSINSGVSFLTSAMGHLGAGAYLDSELAEGYVGQAGTTLSISQIEPTGAFMQGWTSGTSNNYADFASLFGPIAANLSLALGVLKGAYEAEQALWAEARKNVDELAHQTKTKLDKCLDKNPGDVDLALTVLGAVAGVVAVPFTAGGSLVAAYSFATIGAATALGGAFNPEETETPSSITGDVPWEIINSLTDNLTKLNADLVKAEGDIKRALEESAGDFSAAFALDPGQSPVKMPRPSVADNPDLGGRE